ncbi:hypothetical protein MtrunA17_Chr7g0238691 [Medicago truncatula]|uniref:Uncharacterized protein n=1 Tax=Medicago truncatula TaxID=3880 RepID=A0A396H327_MEDTR|nr:hypothetical protein MtrunA17_Chr7g0238691 [Medicago truncatula]
MFIILATSSTLYTLLSKKKKNIKKWVSMLGNKYTSITHHITLYNI